MLDGTGLGFAVNDDALGGVVKPRSTNPAPPSLYWATFAQRRPPSMERSSQLAALEVASSRVLLVAAASWPPSPTRLGAPTGVLWPLAVATTCLAVLPAAPSPEHNVNSLRASAAAIELRASCQLTRHGSGNGRQVRVSAVA